MATSKRRLSYKGSRRPVLDACGVIPPPGLGMGECDRDGVLRPPLPLPSSTRSTDADDDVDNNEDTPPAPGPRPSGVSASFSRDMVYSDRAASWAARTSLAATGRNKEEEGVRNKETIEKWDKKVEQSIERGEGATLPAQEFKSASTLTPVTFTMRGGVVTGFAGATSAPPGVFFSRVGEPNSNNPSPAPALEPLKVIPPLLDRKETLEVLTDRNTPKEAPRRCKLSSPDTSCDKARTRGARSHLIDQIRDTKGLGGYGKALI